MWILRCHCRPPRCLCVSRSGLRCTGLCCLWGTSPFVLVGGSQLHSFSRVLLETKSMVPLCGSALCSLRASGVMLSARSPGNVVLCVRAGCPAGCGTSLDCLPCPDTGSLSAFVSHFQLTGLFQFTVRLASETEARFTSVERINHYIKVRMLQAFLAPFGVLLFFLSWMWGGGLLSLPVSPPLLRSSWFSHKSSWRDW